MSDTLFLAGLGLPPAKLGRSRTGLDVAFTNATKPCAWVRNPRSRSYAHLRFLGKDHPTPALLSSGVQWALNLRPARKIEIRRMVAIFWKISRPGAMAARPHSLTFYALARLNRYPCITDAGGHSSRHVHLPLTSP